jgi:hypothetical protein
MGQYISSSGILSPTQVEPAPLAMPPAEDSLDKLDLSTVVQNISPPFNDSDSTTISGLGSPSTSVDYQQHLSPTDTLTSMGPASGSQDEIIPEYNNPPTSKFVFPSTATETPTSDEIDQSLQNAQPLGHRYAERFSLDELDSQYITSHGPEELYVPPLKFNLEALVQIITETLNVQQPENIEVLGFGCFNKVFLFTFKEARDLIVRMPYINPGNNQMKQIESEVVTMKYAKSKLPVKWAPLVPSVIAYDSNPANTVGQPYIILERAEGCEVTGIWDDLDMSQKRQIVQETAEFTSALHSIGNEFTDIGSLGNENDELRVGPVYSGCLSIDEEFQAPWPTTHKSLMAQLNSMLLDWQTGRFPRATAKHNLCGVPISSIIKVFCDLTTLVTKFEPCKVTGDPNADTPRSLVHPDLNLGNIFVDPKSLRLSAIIDWADAGIHPEWYYTTFPSYLSGPDVYCKDSPMGDFAFMDKWENWRDLTYLRHYYILKKESMEPGFKYRLDKYSPLHKLKLAWQMDFSGFQYEDLAQWVEEEIAEYHTGAAKVE